jgi:hypothetical protein
MNMPRFSRSLELGAIWYAVPLIWICTAVIGWLLLSGWPQLFSDPQSARAVALPAAAAAAAPYESSDPSLPSASRVFEGKPAEVVSVVDTF